MQDASSVNLPMDLSPMGEIEAAKLADQYLAGFAYLSLPDPEGYQSALVNVLRRYPKWAGERAIERANPDNANFPVGSIVMRKWLEEIVTPHRNAATWKSESEQQLADRKMIEDAITAARKGHTYEQFKAEMAERGLPIDGKRVNYADTVAEVKERFHISDSEWEAIPESPGEGHWERLQAVHRR